MFPAFQADSTRVVLDKLFVNGERHDSLTTLPYLDQVTLKHTQSHFSFDVTAFDYSRSQNITYRYRLEGFDKDWTSFSPQSPVTFMNMAPGQYRFVVQAARQNGRDTAEASIPIRIRPAWYATAAAKILFLLLAAAILYIILDSINSRILLAEKLKLKEQENKEKTRFFVDLSYQLRTPVNLVIGQLERFFQKYGSRTAGIEDLENIYGKVILVRQKISDFVNSQNDTLKNNPEEEALSSSYQDAKFLNAAIGVVERNLFSKDMNVSLLCSELNVGKTSLTAKIKEVTGMTPREFIEDVRLKHAAEMLRDNVYRIAEISDNLAFSNPNYFSQRFKRKYGVSPRNFKGK
jgi:AraC-like DNA-binding protein